jgi:hypothetical protein
VQFDLGVLQLEEGLEEFLADFFLRLNCFLQVVPGLDRDLETREIRCRGLKRVVAVVDGLENL